MAKSIPNEIQLLPSLLDRLLDGAKHIVSVDLNVAQNALLELKLAGIRAAKIQGTARPGETVRLEATVSGRMGGLVQVAGSASVDGRLILRCELTLAGETV
jgi:3-hydroxymyristoyl/3-hydroxydecanoyl-(acyl carrier protein) dehydratase